MSTLHRGLKAALTSSAMLTAVNTALTAVSQPTAATGFGIQGHLRLLADAPSFPALAVELDETQRGETLTGGRMQVRGTFTVFVALADGDEPRAYADAETIGDAVVAAYEVSSGLYWVRWESTSVEGEPYDNQPGLPSRLLRLRFEFMTWRNEASREEG